MTGASTQGRLGKLEGLSQTPRGTGRKEAQGDQGEDRGPSVLFTLILSHNPDGTPALDLAAPPTPGLSLPTLSRQHQCSTLWGKLRLGEGASAPSEPSRASS